ncbi:MAG: protein-disulfide reductase DsbD family protein [bacterium]|nr:protein-disulfide reductase DsbD family protein [bacterium]
MRIFFLALCFLLTPLVLLAQGMDFGRGPVGLLPEPKIELLATLSQTNGQWLLHLDGRIPPGFHLYSIKAQGDLGPKPTQLILVEPKLTPIGPLVESEPQLIEDLALDERLWVHQGDFFIEQRYQKPVNGALPVRGFLLFQVCDNLICLNPIKQPFSARLP